MEHQLFTSVEEECRHWKERSLKVTQERNDVQREFDDFTVESRQLEAELEMTVEQQEKKIRDLNHLVSQLRGENESFKRKVQNTENEINKIDADYRLLAKENEKFKIYIRELEQKNDDLERANRVASESVAEFESMLNQAYEKNALLELECDEKERMQIKLQRLMDEARDLKQELKVRNLKTEDLQELENADEASQEVTNSSTGLSEKNTSRVLLLPPGSNTQQTNLCLDGGVGGVDGVLTSGKLESLNNNLNKKMDPVMSKLQELDSVGTALDETGGKLNPLTSPSSQLIIERNGNSPHAHAAALVTGVLNAPMAPSDRASTLNIVADLLRRLDNMEAKLKAWKIRKPSTRTHLAGAHRQHNVTGSSNHLHLHHQYGAGADSSNLSINSAGSGDSASCCSNVQLHSYQPSSITIGTQTSQQPLHPPKAELRTSK